MIVNKSKFKKNHNNLRQKNLFSKWEKQYSSVSSQLKMKEQNWIKKG